MTETDADCLRLMPNRRLGPFHRLRDLDLGSHFGGVCITFRARFSLVWLLWHYLEDGEDNEIGLRARDYRARYGVPWEPLVCSGGG